MKTIGMIVAVEMDAVLARYGRAAGVERCGGFEVHRYEGGDYRLFIVSAGAGELAAAAATELLIAGYGAEMVVNFGVVRVNTEIVTNFFLAFPHNVVWHIVATHVFIMEFTHLAHVESFHVFKFV